MYNLRKSSIFQFVSRHFDPIIRWRLSQFPKPIYLRLVSNASVLLDATTQEASVTETFVAVLSVLPSGNTAAFWDVGANIGCYTWQCAVSRPDLNIVSFEPDPKNLDCLRRTSYEWKLENHIVAPFAVAERAGRAAFRPDDITGTTGTLEVDNTAFNALHYGREARTVEVDTMSLDEFANYHSAPSIIKIDVEGAELRVLQGAATLVRDNHPILLLETLERRSEILRFLEERGYRVFDSDQRRRVNETTVNVIAFVPNARRPVDNALLRLGYPSD